MPVNAVGGSAAVGQNGRTGGLALSLRPSAVCRTVSEQEHAESKQQFALAVQEVMAERQTTFVWNYDDRLKSLPPVIGTLRDQLEVLHLDNNFSLVELCPAVGELRRLRWLNVSYCALQELPTELYRLQKLERLHASNNNLTTLPMEIWQLKDLEEIWVDNNRLQALPSGVLFLPRLRQLYLENNPLLTPIDMAGAEPAALLPPLYADARRANARSKGNTLSARSDAPPSPSAAGTASATSNLWTATPPQFSTIEHSSSAIGSSSRTGGDCANCCARFRNYIVFITFHNICGLKEVPFAHYVCSERCQEQLTHRLDDRDTELRLQQQQEQRQQTYMSVY